LTLNLPIKNIKNACFFDDKIIVRTGLPRSTFR
jgi:hypothetical protein